MSVRCRHFRNYSASYEGTRYQNDICGRSFLLALLEVVRLLELLDLLGVLGLQEVLGSHACVSLHFFGTRSTCIAVINQTLAHALDSTEKT